MNLEQEHENATKAALIDFQCVLMTTPELLEWWDSIPMRHDDPQDAAQALENIQSLYDRAMADGVYPVKTKL